MRRYEKDAQLRRRRSEPPPPTASSRHKRTKALTAPFTSELANSNESELDRFVAEVSQASPFQLIEIERRGVNPTIIRILSRRMGLPLFSVQNMLGWPKATAARKLAQGGQVKGAEGTAAIMMAKLLRKAEEIAKNSLSDTSAFNAAEWLGRWVMQPQPALGGRRPADILDTATGQNTVLRLLGSFESGAYQ